MLRLHRMAKYKIDKNWYQVMHILCRNKLPSIPLKKALITAVVFNSRRYDYDGAVGCLKPLIDGLVHAKVLSNDSYKITGPWDVTQEICKKGSERVKITVEDAEK